jgi:hypothetical protein
MARRSPAPLTPISEQIVRVRASLYGAVETLQSSLEYGTEVPSVSDVAAIVVEQIAELKRLLALLEHEEAESATTTRRHSRALASRAPAA